MTEETVAGVLLEIDQNDRLDRVIANGRATIEGVVASVTRIGDRLCSVEVVHLKHDATSATLAEAPEHEVTTTVYTGELVESLLMRDRMRFEPYAEPELEPEPEDLVMSVTSQATIDYGHDALKPGHRCRPLHAIEEGYLVPGERYRFTDERGALIVGRLNTINPARGIAPATVSVSIDEDNAGTIIDRDDLKVTVELAEPHECNVLHIPDIALEPEPRDEEKAGPEPMPSVAGPALSPPDIPTDLVETDNDAIFRALGQATIEHARLAARVSDLEAADDTPVNQRLETLENGIGSRSAYLRNRLLEWSKRMEVIEARLDAQGEHDVRMVGIAEDHARRLRSLEETSSMHGDIIDNHDTGIAEAHRELTKLERRVNAGHDVLEAHNGRLGSAEASLHRHALVLASSKKFATRIAELVAEEL